MTNDNKVQLKRATPAGMLSLIFALVLAHSGLVQASQEEEIRLTVKENVDELVAYFNKEKNYYESDPERFFKNMDTALAKIVDFRRIAARVMGKHARKADKDQRNRFVEVFKNSLFETYTKTLVESGTFKIRVVKATMNSRSDERASVDLEIESDNGNVYPVIYSMYRNDDGRWMMENVIVFGVNIGLAFRDRFENQMRANRGNVDAVIDTWDVKLDLEQPKEG